MTPGQTTLGDTFETPDENEDEEDEETPEVEEVKREKDFASLGEAIRHMCREGGYDV